jgi:hypothetical protein
MIRWGSRLPWYNSPSYKMLNCDFLQAKNQRDCVHKHPCQQLGCFVVQLRHINIATKSIKGHAKFGPFLLTTALPSWYLAKAYHTPPPQLKNMPTIFVVVVGPTPPKSTKPRATASVPLRTPTTAIEGLR